jgi:hypothetical protein
MLVFEAPLPFFPLPPHVQDWQLVSSWLLHNLSIKQTATADSSI